MINNYINNDLSHTEMIYIIYTSIFVENKD